MKDPDSKNPTLDDLIMDVMHKMQTYAPDDPEYFKFLDQLERLTEMRARKKRRFNVSPDVLAGILGNIAVVLIIVGYEHAHVMTSKGFTFLNTKPIN